MINIKYNFRQYAFPFFAIFTALALIFRPQLITSLLGGVWSAALPVIAGVIFSAVINPAVCYAERCIGRIRRGKSSRALAIACVYLLIAGILAAVIMIIIPRLIKSITLFANSFDSYYSSLRRQLMMLENGELSGLFLRFDSIVEAISAELPDFFRRTFSATAGFFRVAGDIIVGLVFSVYILADKEQLTDFISGAARAVMSDNAYSRISEILVTVYESLVSFISGQLTEAVVLGTLCFFGMVIMDFEYPLLISTIIGVTALVPVVGAIVGTIPSVFMLFLVKPSSALWFVVFIIILQQLENNLIYPKVVGKSVGLPPILVFTAIVMGAKLGGALGIMFSIPLLSAVYVLVKRRLEASHGGRKTKENGGHH